MSIRWFLYYGNLNDIPEEELRILRPRLRRQIRRRITLRKSELARLLVLTRTSAAATAWQMTKELKTEVGTSVAAAISEFVGKEDYNHRRCGVEGGRESHIGCEEARQCVSHRRRRQSGSGRKQSDHSFPGRETRGWPNQGRSKGGCIGLHRQGGVPEPYRTYLFVGILLLIP